MISLRGLHPEVRAVAEIAHEWATFFGIPTTVTSTLRSRQEQQRLRDRYLRGLSRFPANAPGDSAHELGLAWDSLTPATHQENWDIIRRWAGFNVPRNDLIHAEVPGWRRFKK